MAVCDHAVRVVLLYFSFAQIHPARREKEQGGIGVNEESSEGDKERRREKEKIGNEN